jgi:REP element-mobilizing transposase RayT
MARKLRVQFPGALYHVVNRGNYRRDVFESAGAAQAFVTALEEATPTFGWRVHAYVVMRNHYHFVVETPKPNLVSGMHWLQSTLATRFNRHRTERGHLFQGRYHAGLIEDFRVLEHVVDYVHLNPVMRAGMLVAEERSEERSGEAGVGGAVEARDDPDGGLDCQTVGDGNTPECGHPITGTKADPQEAMKRNGQCYGDPC